LGKRGVKTKRRPIDQGWTAPMGKRSKDEKKAKHVFQKRSVRKRKNKRERLSTTTRRMGGSAGKGEGGGGS